MMDLKYWTMRLTTAENGFRFSQGLRAAEEDEVIEGVNRVLLIASRETTGAVIAQFSGGWSCLRNDFIPSMSFEVAVMTAWR
jgi:hypothetical protein